MKSRQVYRHQIKRDPNKESRKEQVNSQHPESSPHNDIRNQTLSLNREGLIVLVYFCCPLVLCVRLHAEVAACMSGLT